MPGTPPPNSSSLIPQLTLGSAPGGRPPARPPGCPLLVASCVGTQPGRPGSGCGRPPAAPGSLSRSTPSPAGTSGCHGCVVAEGAWGHSMGSVAWPRHRGQCGEDSLVGTAWWGQHGMASMVGAASHLCPRGVHRPDADGAMGTTEGSSASRWEQDSQDTWVPLTVARQDRV